MDGLGNERRLPEVTHRVEDAMKRLSWNPARGRMLTLCLLVVAARSPMETECAAQQQQEYAIRRSTPFQVGDRWRSQVTSVKTTGGTVTTAGKRKTVNEKQTTRLTATVTVHEVDDDGYALHWSAKIINFERSQTGKARQPVLPSKTTVHFARQDGKIVVTHENGAALIEPASDIKDYLRLPSQEEDTPLEPPGKKPVGAQWIGDVESMRERVIAAGPRPLKRFPEVLSIAASGTLEEVKDYRGVMCLQASYRTQTKTTQRVEQMRQYIDKAESTFQEQLLIPADYSRGVLQRRNVRKETMKTTSKGSAPSLNVRHTTTQTERRTYLHFEGGGLRPWKGNQERGALLDQLLTALTFDRATITGSGEGVRIRSTGKIARPLRIKATAMAKGQIGDGVKMDGRDDHVHVEGASQALRAGVRAVSVSCWLRTTTSRLQLIFDTGVYGDASFSLHLQSEEATFHVTPKAGGVDLTFPLDATEWTHVVVVWDGTQQVAYVDGEEVGKKKTSSAGKLDQKTLGDLPFLIGSQTQVASRRNRYFLGEFDEFAIWTRALSAAEVEKLYAKGEKGQTLLVD